MEEAPRRTAVRDPSLRAQVRAAAFPLPLIPRCDAPGSVVAGDPAVGGVRGAPVTMLSAGSLIAMDAFGLAARRDAILSARSVDDLTHEVAPLPELFVELVEARLQAPVVTRIYTALADALTSRLIELSVASRGAPEVAFAWLAFGSAARGELTPFSDQDNGLAYEDTDDPSVDAYFLRLATDVDLGLDRCGLPLDPHGVLAMNADWRRQASDWVALFSDCLRGWDNDRLLRAAVGFDVRQVAGDLSIVPLLTAVIRRASGHSRFLGGLAELGAEIPSPLRFRGRLKGRVDVKRRGLFAVQNLARYYACSAGLTAVSTVERLVAVGEAGARGSDVAGPLREAYVTMAGLQARHQAEAFRRGDSPHEPIDTAALDPEARAGLQQALRLVASVQERMPRRAAL